MAKNQFIRLTALTLAGALLGSMAVFSASGAEVKTEEAVGYYETYGSQTMLGFTNVNAWKDAAEAEIVVRVQGNTLSIGLPGEEPLFAFEDAQPFTHGLCGFFGTGKELTVLSCGITPLE